MDPCVRREVWDLILASKKERVVVMTTHSMQEADILGDTIAIMSQGRLVAQGTPLSLKNRYAGYDISLVVKEEDAEAMTNIVEDLLASARQRGEPQKIESGLLFVYNVQPEL